MIKVTELGASQPTYINKDKIMLMQEVFNSKIHTAFQHTLIVLDGYSQTLCVQEQVHQILKQIGK